MARCTSTCIAKEIDITALARELGLEDTSPAYRDVLYWPDGAVHRPAFWYARRGGR